eukprot:5878726-Amphidinium_carterae.1
MPDSCGVDMPAEEGSSQLTKRQERFQLPRPYAADTAAPALVSQESLPPVVSLADRCYPSALAWDYILS